jgi:hypothetical protein
LIPLEERDSSKACPTDNDDAEFSLINNLKRPNRQTDEQMARWVPTATALKDMKNTTLCTVICS